MKFLKFLTIILLFRCFPVQTKLHEMISTEIQSKLQHFCLWLFNLEKCLIEQSIAVNRLVRKYTKENYKFSLNIENRTIELIQKKNN